MKKIAGTGRYFVPLNPKPQVRRSDRQPAVKSCVKSTV